MPEHIHSTVYDCRFAAVAALTAGLVGCGGGQSFDDGSDEVSRTNPTRVAPTGALDGGGPADEASAIGATDPSLDTASLEDFSFQLTVPFENWVEPRGVGDDIGPFVPTFGVARAGEMIWVGSLDETGARDSCFPGVVVGMPDANGPIAPFELPVRLQNGDIEVAAKLVDFTLSDVLSDEGPTAGGTLRATLDAREIVPLFILLAERTPDALCSALSAGLATDCEACKSDGQPYCLTVTAASPLLAELPGSPDIGSSAGKPCPDAGL